MPDQDLFYYNDNYNCCMDGYCPYCNEYYGLENSEDLEKESYCHNCSNDGDVLPDNF